VSGLDGAVIGQAHYATRAALENILGTRGLGFPAWVTLTAVHDGRNSPDALVERVRQTAVYPVEEVDDVLAQLRGLVEEGTALTVTDAGTELVREVRRELSDLTAHLYGDLPVDDLETAGRVLELVTARARALLV
jgi:hypothetical protein